MEKIITNTLKSITIGLLVCVVLGFLFSNTKYYYHGYEISEKTEKSVSKEEFNIKIGLISGAITTMLFMFILYDEKNRNIIQKWKKSIYDKLKSNKTNKPKLIFIKKQVKSLLYNEGRMGRLEYIFKIITLKLIFYLLFVFFDNNLNDSIALRITILIVFGIIYLYILSNLMIKRLHDMNISVWSILVYSILIGVAFPFFELETFFNIVSIIYIIFFLIILPFYPGTKTNNKYGIKPD